MLATEVHAKAAATDNAPVRWYHHWSRPEFAKIIGPRFRRDGRAKSRETRPWRWRPARGLQPRTMRFPLVYG